MLFGHVCNGGQHENENWHSDPPGGLKEHSSSAFHSSFHQVYQIRMMIENLLL